MLSLIVRFVVVSVFSLRTSDASIMAMNDKMIVAVYNNRHQFAIQLASVGTACISNFSNTSYVTSVAVGRASNRTSFAFIADDLNINRSFLASMTVSENCTFGPASILPMSSASQRLSGLLVHPTDQLLFAFAVNLTVVWEPDSNRSEMWPSNVLASQFLVDNNRDYLVTISYPNSTASVITLMNLSMCNTNTTFQSCLTPVCTLAYGNVSSFTMMSVKINDIGSVLWSMGSQLALLSIANNTFNLINTIDITRTILDLAWADNDSFTVLTSSQVLSFTANLTSVSTFPNTWKKLCANIIANFTTIASSNVMGLAIRDVSSSVYIIRPTTPGAYPVTNTGCVIGVYFGFSSENMCSPGSYHRETALRPCSPCPPGTFNDGNYSVQCAPCGSLSFCPLGAVAIVDGSSMSNVLQASAYPKSPDSTIFDDILLQNIFSLQLSRHCLVVSPIFWTIIVIIFILLLISVMGASKWFPRLKNARQTIKYVFKQTDLIGEGEMWIGGMVSFSVVVLIAFAYAFSTLYLQQYPIESSHDSSFACNPNLRNSKFSTQMQVIGIPLSDEVQPIFDLLDRQPYTLNVDFVNTLFRCQQVSVQQTVGTVITLITAQNCSEHGGILSVSVALPFHAISIQIILSGPLTVGGIRTGLSGPEAHDGEDYVVRELGFMQGYAVQNRTLSSNPTLQLQLIRLINNTEPLVDGGKTHLSALWIPTFSYVSDQLFLTETQYVGNSRNQTLLAVSLSEKAYFVMNTQTPITKQTEVIFRSILFTVVCLELFGLLFIIFKLLFVPMFRWVVSKYQWMHTSHKVEATSA